uniref:hypothetical protein n=1 Tax=Brachyspira catarrhinii TaxID=2528966 RepID=UPI003F4B2812
MILTNNNYSISVNDDDKNKCSKDCKYLIAEYKDLCVCALITFTSEKQENVLIKDYNRTEYCKEFFENLRD